MSSLARVGTTIALVAALSGCWQSEPETLTDSSQTKVAALLNDKNGIQTEINNILRSWDTLRGIKFVKAHTTEGEFTHFMDKLVMLVIDEQYPGYLNPWFFFDSFLKTKPEFAELKINFSFWREGGFPWNTLDSALALVDVQQAISSLAPERKKLYRTYFKTAETFYDQNQDSIRKLVDDYHANTERINHAIDTNPEIAAQRSRQEAKKAEIYAKYNVQEGDSGNPHSKTAHDEYFKWLVATGWEEEAKIVKRVARVPYYTYHGWDVSAYMQPRLAQMKGYQNLQAAHRAIHAERLRTKESVVW